MDGWMGWDGMGSLGRKKKKKKKKKKMYAFFHGESFGVWKDLVQKTETKTKTKTKTKAHSFIHAGRTEQRAENTKFMSTLMCRRISISVA